MTVLGRQILGWVMLGLGLIILAILAVSLTAGGAISGLVALVVGAAGLGAMWAAYKLLNPYLR